MGGCNSRPTLYRQYGGKEYLTWRKEYERNRKENEGRKMKRRIFAQYYDENGRELLGSTGVTSPMDGRWSVRTCHQHATEQGILNRKIKPSIDGYRLFLGEGYKEIQVLSGYRRI